MCTLLKLAIEVSHNAQPWVTMREGPLERGGSGNECFEKASDFSRKTKISSKGKKIKVYI